MMSLPFLNMSGSAAVAGRAVVEKEKSDIQGRDHASLGRLCTKSAVAS
jgi:hypothetical protein